MSRKNIYQLPTPSEEQEYILTQFLLNKNVIVNSVAGSGKTTLMCHASLAQTNKQILIITYNKILRHETKERIRKLGLSERVEVHTYHSFAYKYYRANTINDDNLQDLLDDIEENRVEPKDDTFFDIIMIDEAQDMTPNYNKIICYFVEQNSNNRNMQYMVVGDPYQTLYAFKGANPEYLTKANEHFQNTTNEWIQCNLSVSYRLTPKTVSFLNTIIGEERIRPGNLISPNENVEYIRCNIYKEIYKIFVEQSKKYGYKNIAILSRTVKHKNSPLDKLDKKLCKNRIPSFVARNDISNNGDNIKKNKVYIGTFNSSKGSEYGCVMVILDSYNNHGLEDMCSNNVYVALSRSIYKLIVLQHNRNNPYSRVLDTVQTWDHQVVSQIGEQLTVKDRSGPSGQIVVDVTELLKFMDPDILKNIVEEFLTITEIRRPDRHIIKTETEIDFIYIEEDVSNLYGISIPIALENLFSNTIKLAEKIAIPNLFETEKQLKEYVRMFPNEKQYCKLISEYDREFPVEYREQFLESYNQVKDGNTDAKYLLFVANGISAFQDYHNVIHQISHYDWVQQDTVDYGLNFLTKIVKYDMGRNRNFLFEKSYITDNILNHNVKGRSDLVIYKNNNIIVHEFKWKVVLERTDYLQLAAYVSFEMLNNRDKIVVGKLSNSRNKSLYEVKVPDPLGFLEKLVFEYSKRQR